jgi:hypothetical protein
MRGSTDMALLFHGRRLNPDVFPPDTFINERRIFLNQRFDFRPATPPPGRQQNVAGDLYVENGWRAFDRARVGLGKLSFLDVGWCRGVREGEQITIVSKTLGMWTAMTNRVVSETYTEDDKHARATLTFAMTKNHMLAGEEMLAVHWDKVG